MQISQTFQRLGQFSKSSNKLTLNKTIKNISRHFINDSWDLGDRKFHDLHAQLFFRAATLINGKTLWIDYNKKPSIIREICGPNFVFLQTIYLGDNNITSLQSISFLNVPQLKLLALNDNLISNLQSFSKWNFKNLQYVSLNGNRVFQLETLQRSKLQKLQKLKVLDQMCPMKAWQNINVLWMMKTDMGKQIAQIFFDPKFNTTPELCLIKLKLRRKNYIHPCSMGLDNSSSCSPLPAPE